MNPMRTLIVDDEPLARQRIRELIEGDPELEIVGECGFGEDALTVLRGNATDLVFLDVRLPDLTGFEILDKLDEDERPLVIFVTAYDEHAVRAFDVRALDYLVKPFDRTRLCTAVGRAKRAFRARSLLLTPAVAPRAPGGRFAVRTDGKVLRVRLDEIERIEAERDFSRFHLRGGSVIEARESLASVAERLPASAFLRVHRSHVVNIARVREIQPWSQGEFVLVLEDGSQVITGRTYRERIRVLLQ